MDLIAERKWAKIYEDTPWNYYEVVYPAFSEREQKFLDEVETVLSKNYTVKDIQMMYVDDKDKAHFVETVGDLKKELDPFAASVLDPDQEKEALAILSKFVSKNAPFAKKKEELVSVLYRSLVGMGKIGFLTVDDSLEEIMVNGSAKPIYVFDRRYGVCRTSLQFNTDDEIREVINRISSFVAKDVTDQKPMLDARLPDGSRVNATIPPATPKGPTITIRKFRKKPLTVTEMIARNTLDADLAAFLWMCVEGLHVAPVNCLVAGSTGSGKTTTLNALSVFIPPRERVISIEDTLELNLYNRPNWVQLEARPSIYQEALTLDDLLKNSLRMRPDRVLVGEVRGPEAETLFVAMDVGHEGVMSTVHANSAQETLLRLQSAPMNVPKSMFVLLDLILMQHRMYWPRKGLIRRITQVSEVSVMGEHVLLNDIYRYDRDGDKIARTELPSQIVEKLSFHTGQSKTELEGELSLRTKVLQGMVDKKIFEYLDIYKTINNYYDDPQKVARQFS